MPVPPLPHMPSPTPTPVPTSPGFVPVSKYIEEGVLKPLEAADQSITWTVGQIADMVTEMFKIVKNSES